MKGGDLIESRQHKSKCKPLPEEALRYIEEFNRRNRSVFQDEV